MSVTVFKHHLLKCSRPQQINQKMKIVQMGIAFLQESYSDSAIEDSWRAVWGGDILFSHSSKHSRGIMTLFRPSLNVNFLNVHLGKNGRSLIISENINQEELCLFNIHVYAPNAQMQQVNFFTKLMDISIRRFTTEKIIVGEISIAHLLLLTSSEEKYSPQRQRHKIYRKSPQ